MAESNPYWIREDLTTRYPLPSLNALRALEAAGRQGSLTGAARELSVSVGAISRHVALLEGHFGRTLLRRHSLGVEPTDECHDYLRALSNAFNEIDTASHRLADRRNSSKPLRLSFYSTFTTEWLAGRLPDFHEKNPGIALDFTLSPHDTQWRNEDFDAALVASSSEFGDFRQERLFDSRFALVAAPQLLSELRGPGDLLDFLHNQTLLVAPRELRLWNAVLDALDAGTLDDYRCLRFDLLSLTYQAARNGGGVALGNLLIVADDLASKRLALLIPQVFDSSVPHQLIRRRGRTDTPRLAKFQDWLTEEIRKSEIRLEPVLAGCTIHPLHRSTRL